MVATPGDAASFDRAVRVAVYRHTVAECAPPSADEIAHEVGATTAEVETSLRRLGEGHILVLARRDRDLLSGPARLCQAFGLDRDFDGADLVTADRGVTIVDDGVPPPAVPAVTTRIGLSVGTELRWRWCSPDSLHLSKRI